MPRRPHMGVKRAFEAAGAPLRNHLNHWSATSPGKDYVVVTIWQHELDRFGTNAPVLGSALEGASRYFHNDAAYIRAWNEERIAAGRRPIDSLIGWRALKEHLALARSRDLPVRAVVVVTRKPPKGADAGKVDRVEFRPDWDLRVTSFDQFTGAYELAIRLQHS